jgi:bacterioferritin
MVMGHNRIPIQKWLRDKALEGVDHAVTIGEKITSLGGHPPMSSINIEETNIHSVNQLLQESHNFETQGLDLYKKLASLSANDIALEELARNFVKNETEHLEEVEKMLRTQ